MIADLKPYPQMKDSGVEWLGDVPAHWRVMPLKWCSRCHSGDGISTEAVSAAKTFQRNIPVIGGNGIMGFGENTNCYDAVLAIGRVGALCGNVHAVQPPAWITDNALVLSVDSATVSLEFLAATLKGRNLNNLADKTAQPLITGTRVQNEHVPFPPLPEQSAIVRYLDHVGRRIQRYIRAKQKLIALLEEQKQVVIHQAVTGQIDVRTGRPYPAYKDSGVEWLGKVPEHWGRNRLKSIARIRYGLGQPPRELSDGLPLIRATNVDHGRIVEKNLVYIDPLDVPKSRDAFLSKKEIIVVRSGAYTADSAIIPETYEGAVAGYDMIVTANRAEPEFIAFALLSNYVRDDQLIIASTRSAQPHLNAEELGSAVFLLPTFSEQHIIVRYLDKAIANIEISIVRARHQIELLREYRTRLIADVVTGKLDVREAAERLPDEIEGSLPLDEAKEWSNPGDDGIERSEALH